MRRLLLVLTCLMLGLPLSPAQAARNYQDMWWLPEESGWGLMVLHQADTISAVMFHYRADRAPVWYLLSNAQRSTGEQFSGSLFEVTGPPLFGNFDSASVMPRAVGNMRIAFSTDDTASLSYTIDGRSSSRTIRRITFAALDVDGVYLGSQFAVLRCGDNPQVGSYVFPTNTIVVGGSLRSTLSTNSLLDNGSVSCSWNNVNQRQQGSRILGEGPFACTGTNANLSHLGEVVIEDMRVIDHALVVNYHATVTYPGANTTCQERGTISGTRLTTPQTD